MECQHCSCHFGGRTCCSCGEDSPERKQRDAEAKKAVKKRGNCYVTCEALWHLMGGKKSEWLPMYVKHEGDTHWFLGWKVWAAEHPVDRSRRYGQLPASVVIDPTAKQFKTQVPYHLGKGCGFLTKKPSKRARALMQQMLWQK